LVYAHNKGYNPWLWISAELEPEKKNELIQSLVERGTIGFVRAGTVADLRFQ
jgi:hypothetical protein